MNNKKTRTTVSFKLVIMLALVVCLLGGLAACSSTTNTESSDSIETNSNVTIVDGEYDTISDDPDMLADGTAGISVHEGAGDETLQQDRVSGGANTGGVMSENLDPLENPLTKPQKEFSSTSAMSSVGTPAAVPHVLEGREDCSSCHADSGSSNPMPQSHIKADITGDLCLICHKSAA